MDSFAFLPLSQLHCRERQYRGDPSPPLRLRRVETNGLVCISAQGAEINVATSVCTGGSNSPPDWNGICQGCFPLENVGAAIGRPLCTAGFYQW